MLIEFLPLPQFSYNQNIDNLTKITNFCIIGDFCKLALDRFPKFLRKQPSFEKFGHITINVHLYKVFITFAKS